MKTIEDHQAARTVMSRVTDFQNAISTYVDPGDGPQQVSADEAWESWGEAASAARALIDELEWFERAASEEAQKLEELDLP